MIASCIYNCNADSSTGMSKSNTQRAKKNKLAIIRGPDWFNVY